VLATFHPSAGSNVDGFHVSAAGSVGVPAEPSRASEARIVLTSARRASEAGGRRHLDRVLRTYIGHYNQARPHRGLGLQSPVRSQWPTAGDLMAADVRRRDVLGGLVHEYSIAA
jgi:hypothetical protein